MLLLGRVEPTEVIMAREASRTSVGSAGERTRTSKERQPHRDLNPARLPIPPRPRDANGRASAARSETGELELGLDPARYPVQELPVALQGRGCCVDEAVCVVRGRFAEDGGRSCRVLFVSFRMELEILRASRPRGEAVVI